MFALAMVGLAACGETERSKAGGSDAGSTSSNSGTTWASGGQSTADTGVGGNSTAAVTGTGGTASITSATTTSATTGMGTTTGTGGTDAVGGAGGAAGAGAGVLGDGIGCANGMVCPVGTVCANCDFLGDAIEPICVPHPDRDPQSFQMATERCPAVNLWAECDGAEDCTAGELCSVVPIDPSDPDRRFTFGGCSPEPRDCSSSRVAGCTLCDEASDCPEGWECSESLSLWDISDRMGCVPE
jgi:hypothetical protein